MGLISRVSSRTYSEKWRIQMRTQNGILPKLEKPKPEDREEEDMTEKKENLDEVNLTDLDDDDEFIEMYKQQRIKQLQAQLAKNKFGNVLEITGIDYVDQVNKAGDDIWVILHLY